MTSSVGRWDRVDDLLSISTQIAPLQSGKASIIPFGAIFNPEPLPGLKLPNRFEGLPVECTHCAAYATNLAKINPSDNASWICPFCGDENPPCSFISEIGQAVEYETRKRSDTIKHQQQPRFIAIDLHSSPEQLKRLKSAAIQALQGAPDDCRVAVLPFCNVASACRLSTPFHTGQNHSTDISHLDIIAYSDAYDIGAFDHRHQYIRQLDDSCRQELCRCIESLTPQKLTTSDNSVARLQHVVNAVVHLLKIRCDGSSSSSIDAKQNASQYHTETHVMERPQDSSGAAQLILLTASQSLLPFRRHSPDSANAYDNEGEEEDFRIFQDISSLAARQGIVIDVLALTDGGLSSMLGMLAAATGGLALPHANIGSAMAANLQDILSRSIGMPCTIEIRCSLGLKVVAAMGAVAPLTSLGSIEKARDRHSTAKTTTITTLLNNIPPRFMAGNVWSFLANPPDAHQSLTVVLETTSAAVAQNYLYLQATAAWTSVDGTEHYRIATQRIKAPSTFQQGGVDDAHGVKFDVAAVIMAKQIAMEAIECQASRNRMEAEIMRRGIGTLIKEMAEKLGTRDESSRKGWLFSVPQTRLALPSGSLPLALTAYFMQRSPLQKFILGDVDARDAFLDALISAPLHVAHRMCMPSLHVVLPSVRSINSHEALSGPTMELQPVPAVDVILFLSCGGVVDAGNVVFVWINSAYFDVENDPTYRRVFNACMECAHRIASSRLPQADVVIVPHGDTNDDKVRDTMLTVRQLFARLRPLVMDSRDVQISQVPSLTSFSKDQMATVEEELTHIFEKMHTSSNLGSGSSSVGYDQSMMTLVQWLDRYDVMLPRI